MRLLKYFVVLFLLAFFVINWNEVSWIFSLKAVLRYFSAQSVQSATIALDNEAKEHNSDVLRNENSIEIPKIGIAVPLVIDDTLDNKGVFKALDRGAVYYPKSAKPGQKGQTIILGHSAPPGWPKIKYDWIFSKINELKENDKVFVNFNGKRYVFTVRRQIILKKGEKVPQPLTDSNNVLALISCWPPGKDVLRVAVMAEKL